MVKADYKHDYYADLELPSNADTETIKKRFRELAKQYHPDRNPGREVDVVPKFQAIQAAHEVLGDANQKAKYDAERAKLSNKQREVESPTFKKPPPPRRTDSGFPPNGAFQQSQNQPPPRRDPSATRYAPQSATRQRPQSANVSTADKFTSWAKGAPPQQWNRARFEEAARAEGLRGMNAMRGGPAPQPSPVRPRHPTAPKSAGADPYSSGGEPSPGFPGLHRTASGRRFAPNVNDGDEPRSAYAHYHRSERERPPSAGPFPNIDPQARPRDSVSPLRQTRSFHPDDYSARPGLNRTTSRPYARTGGERINVNTNLGRSASVRGSPVDRDRGAFGNRSAEEDRIPRPRHRSLSPKSKPSGAKFEYASETSSSGEDEIPPPQERRKAQFRRPHAQTTASNGDGPGLTGYFPNTNYTRIIENDQNYQYPAPEARGTPMRKPFSHMASPTDSHDASVTESPLRTPSQEGVPNQSNQNAEQTGQSQSAGFRADEWHEHLNNSADMFNPPEITTRDRKSPTKPNRNARGSQTKTYPTQTESQPGMPNGDVDPLIAAGVRHVNPDQVSSRATAFQPGKLGPDFNDRVGRAKHEANATSPGAQRTGDGHVNGEKSTLDEMDIDSPAPAGTESPGSSQGPFNVTVEEETSPSNITSNASPRQNLHRNLTDPTSKANGFNMNDMKNAFRTPESGLEDLNDLADNIPFQSRPAESLEALHRTSSNTLRHLNLPRPPKVPPCPADRELSQESWRKYGESMTNYMLEWSKFNAAMIEHFRQRQEAVTHGMYRNWVCAQGDGASAEDFEASRGSDRAGYATYMTWLEDDRKSRTWWDIAVEEHRLCMEGLGRVRKRVKELNARAG